MKARLTLPFLLLAGPLAAQPTMTSSDAPAVGEQFVYGTGAYMTLPAGAAGQTWDFSASGGDLAPALTVVAASSALGASDFPNADVALTTTDYGQFFEITSTGLDHWGYYQPTGNTVYSDPETMLPFPCTYGQTWNDAFAASFSSGTFTGNVTATASGYGTLILPSITLDNVLRMDMTQTETASSGLGTVTTQSIFYRPGTGYFVADNEVISVYYGTTLLSADSEFIYIDASSLGIREAAQASIGLQLVPNPATDHTSLVFGAAGAARVEVIDAEGRTVLTRDMGTFAPGVHRFNLDLEGIPAGLYMVQVTNAKGERGMQRLVVQ